MQMQFHPLFLAGILPVCTLHQRNGIRTQQQFLFEGVQHNLAAGENGLARLEGIIDQMRLLRRHDGLEGKGVGIVGEQDLVDHLGFVPGDMLVSLEHIAPDCHLDLLLHGVGQRNGTLPNGLAHDDRHFVRLEGQPRGVKPDGRRLGLVQQTAVAPASAARTVPAAVAIAASVPASIAAVLGRGRTGRRRCSRAGRSLGNGCFRRLHGLAVDLLIGLQIQHAGELH